MADKHRVKNFSLDTTLCAWLEQQALLENRPQSRVVSRALRDYRTRVSFTDAEREELRLIAEKLGVYETQ